MRVTKSKESVARMVVRVISGLQLSITAGGEGGSSAGLFKARTTYSQKLAAMYQVGNESGIAKNFFF